MNICAVLHRPNKVFVYMYIYNICICVSVCMYVCVSMCSCVNNIQEEIMNFRSEEQGRNWKGKRRGKNNVGTLNM